MWYSKHHYASELAKDHVVYFITPPDKWRLSDLFQRKIRLRKIPEGIVLVEYRNYLPLRILPTALASLMHRITARKLARLLSGKGDILWAFHPTPIVLQKVLRTPGTKLIYHVVDPYDTLPFDSACAQAANLVVTVNAGFQEYYSNLNTNLMLVPHGVRTVDRIADLERVMQHQRKLGPYVVLAGALNYRVNFNLLRRAAQNFPQLCIALAGPLPTLPPALEAERSNLLAMPNVFHAGILHPDELRNLVRGANAGIVAYNYKAWTLTATKPSGSLKVLTYLAQLRPVISTINSNIPELDGAGVYHVTTDEEFLFRWGQAAEDTLALNEDRVCSYLDMIEYPVLIQEIFKALNDGHVGFHAPME